jgi:hypothetical protein
MADRRKPSLFDLGLIPDLRDDMEDVFYWLEKNKFTRKGKNYQKNLFDKPPEYGQPYNEDSLTVIAAPTKRSEKLSRSQIKVFKEEYKGKADGLTNVNKDALWQVIKTRNESVRELDFERLPADSMAFYRPFHYPPFDQWGIYLMIQPLLKYHSNLTKIIARFGIYSTETLMHLILFEVFHHEFFHHLAESAATTLEIICAAMGKPQQIYLKYKHRQHNDLIDYPHVPLEEALANAYAWNSLCFISRVKAGYKTGAVNFYQKSIEKHWKLEPPGYRDASFYIKSNHIPGGAHLLAQIMGKTQSDSSAPLMKLAQAVMPSGFSAFIAKPDIPAWLVGTPAELDAFYNLVPAPNEAYTQLFWPYDTSELDKYIQQRKKEEKEAREKAKLLRS